MDAVRQFHADGGTVVLTSHYLEEVEALAERVVVVDRGQVRADGSLAEISSKVASRRVRFRAASAPVLPGVERSTKDGDAWELWTANSDTVVRELVSSGTAFRDLEVSSASLEEAFLALTFEPDATGGPTSRRAEQEATR